MANRISFSDFAPDVAAAMESAAQAWLEEAAGELETQIRRNADQFVDTGRTKGSYAHRVDDSRLEAFVGSDYENAIWEEFGTGVYAEKGGRTKVPWFYKDAEGKGHITSGKRPRRIVRSAYTTMRPKLIKAAQNRFKNVMGGE